MNIPKLVRDSRKALGLTQKALAVRSKVSQAQISKLEKGLQEPKFASLISILKVLGINVKLEVSE